MSASTSQSSRASLCDGRLNLSGRRAVVTGAAQGIGLAYARALAACGVRVVITDTNVDAGDAAALALSSQGYACRFLAADVSDAGSVGDLADAVSRSGDDVDILVNNAGIWGGLAPAGVFEIDPERWRKVVDVNLTGMWLVTRALAPAMRSGRGAIVNQGSIASLRGVPEYADYAASKAAVVSLTKSMARELGPQGVRVNAILPGGIDTPATAAKTTRDRAAATVSAQCIGRRGLAEDLAGPLLFLVSDASQFITGHALVVDGGLTA